MKRSIMQHCRFLFLFVYICKLTECQDYHWRKPIVENWVNPKHDYHDYPWMPYIGFPEYTDNIYVKAIFENLLENRNNAVTFFKYMRPHYFTYNPRGHMAISAKVSADIKTLEKPNFKKSNGQSKDSALYYLRNGVGLVFPGRGSKGYVPLIFIQDTKIGVVLEKEWWHWIAFYRHFFYGDELQRWLFDVARVDGMIYIVPENIFSYTRYHVLGMQVSTSVVLSIEKVARVENVYQWIEELTEEMFCHGYISAYRGLTHGYTLTTHLLYEDQVRSMKKYYGNRDIKLQLQIHVGIENKSFYRDALPYVMNSHNLAYYMDGLYRNYTGDDKSLDDIHLFVYSCYLLHYTTKDLAKIPFQWHVDTRCEHQLEDKLMQDLATSEYIKYVSSPTPKHKIYFISESRFFLRRDSSNSVEKLLLQYNWYKPKTGKDICISFLTDVKILDKHKYAQSKNFYYDHVKHESGVDWPEQFMMTYLMCRQAILEERSMYKEEVAINFKPRVLGYRTVGVVFVIPESFTNPIFKADIVQYMETMKYRNNVFGILGSNYDAKIATATFGEKSLKGTQYECSIQKKPALTIENMSFGPLVQNKEVPASHIFNAILACAMSNIFGQVDHKIVIAFGEAANSMKLNALNYNTDPDSESINAILVTEGKSEITNILQNGAEVYLVDNYHTMRRAIEIQVSKVLRSLS